MFENAVKIVYSLGAVRLGTNRKPVLTVTVLRLAYWGQSSLPDFHVVDCLENTPVCYCVFGLSVSGGSLGFDWGRASVARFLIIEYSCFRV